MYIKIYVACCVVEFLSNEIGCLKLELTFQTTKSAFSIMGLYHQARKYLSRRSYESLMQTQICRFYVVNYPYCACHAASLLPLGSEYAVS